MQLETNQNGEGVPCQTTSKISSPTASQNEKSLVGGHGMPIHHFGDETGIIATIIQWSDGRLFLRQSNNKPFLKEIVVKQDTFSP